MTTPPPHSNERAWMLPLVAAHRSGLDRQADQWVDLVLSTTDLDRTCRTAHAREWTGSAWRAAVVGGDRAELVQALRALQDRAPHPGAFGPCHVTTSPGAGLVLAVDLRSRALPHPLWMEALTSHARLQVRRIVLLRNTDTSLDRRWAAHLPSAPWVCVSTVGEAARAITGRRTGGVSPLVVEAGSDHLAPALVDLLPHARVTATGTTQPAAARAAAEVYLWHHATHPPHASGSLPPGVEQGALLSALAHLRYLPEGVCATQSWHDLGLGGAELARLVQHLRAHHGWAHLTCHDVTSAPSFAALIHGLITPRTLVPHQAAPP